MIKKFALLLTVLFIGLKLTGHVDWSWLIVMSPILAFASIIVFLCFLLGICAFVSKKFK